MTKNPGKIISYEEIIGEDPDYSPAEVNKGLVEALTEIKNLQDRYHDALSPEYCPDTRYIATEALTKYKGGK
jgi:hypothetical protein